MKYVELIVNKGADFNTTIYITNPLTGNVVNISGNTVSSKFRTSYYTANATGSFSANVSNAANGEITLSLTANTSNVKPGKYVYDVETIGGEFGANVTRIQEGVLVVTPEASW